MEDKNEQYTNDGNVSDAVFGTSSDAIIEGLHQGIFTAQSDSDNQPENGVSDKNQIVNEQDQNDITNALEDDDYNTTATNPTTTLASADTTPLMSKDEAEAILTESEHLDETRDTEAAVTPRNSENEKIN